MRRGTTPTLVVTVGADLSGLEVHLAINSGGLLIKETSDLEIEIEDGTTTITAKLTQNDTLAMKSGQNCEVQVRAYTADGSIAMATTIGSVPVDRILEDGFLGGD